MERLTGYDADGHLIIHEEERILCANGIMTKNEAYKVMRHLAERLAGYEDKMKNLEQILNKLNEYDGYLQRELVPATDKNVALYEHWIDCAGDVEKLLKEFSEPKPKAASRFLHVPVYEGKDGEESVTRLVKLPYAVGDTVYVISKAALIEEETVHKVQYRGEEAPQGQRFLLQIGHLLYNEQDLEGVVFETKEEAEAVLEKAKKAFWDGLFEEAKTSKEEAADGLEDI